MLKITKIPQLFKIDIITLNKITNPPTKKRVFIELRIALESVSPKELKERSFLFKFKLDCECLEIVLPEIKPSIIATEIEANKCEMSNKKPVVVLPNNPIPTVAIINKGPELLENVRSLLPSSFEIKELFLN